MNQIIQKFPFKENQSYKHSAAIDVLISWISNDFERVVKEEKFFMKSILWFIPDVTCYNKNGVCIMYEVVKTNPVSIIKQWRMWLYFQIHKWDVKVYQIDSDWILNKTEKPNYLNFQRII